MAAERGHRTLAGAWAACRQNRVRTVCGRRACCCWRGRDACGASAATPQCAPLAPPANTARHATGACRTPQHTLHETPPQATYKPQCSSSPASDHHDERFLVGTLDTARRPGLLHTNPRPRAGLGHRAGRHHHARRHAGRPGATTTDSGPACAPKRVPGVYAINHGTAPAGLRLRFGCRRGSSTN